MSNEKKSKIPWARAVSLSSPLWENDEMWADGVEFKDPSKIPKANCLRLLKHWRKLQEGALGTRAFKLKGYISETRSADQQQVICADLSNAYFERHRKRYEASQEAQPAPMASSTTVFAPAPAIAGPSTVLGSSDASKLGGESIIGIFA